MHVIPPLVSLAGGFAVAEAVPLETVVEKGSLGAVATVTLWWVLGKLSKQLDALDKSISNLGDQVRQMPCDRVKDLEAILSEKEKK